MKRQNIIAFVLGLIAAILLWVFYLQPKYEIHTGDKETMAELKQADMDALDQATAEIPGQVLYSTAAEERGEYDAKDDVISTAQTAPESFDFQSTANKPLDPYQQAALGDKRKSTRIALDSTNVKVNPDMSDKMPEALPQDESMAENQELKNRLTMIKIPVDYKLIKTAKDYEQFKKDNVGPYRAKVDFAKEMILFLESGSNLSSGFLDIDSVKEDKDVITVFYRVNIIGTAQKQDIMPYKIIDKSDKKLVLEQIK